MTKLKLNDDQIRDISIKIVDEFVKQGLCPDCQDTDNETEFEFQDIVTEVLTKEIKNLL
jgi:hypothetical protein